MRKIIMATFSLLVACYWMPVEASECEDYINSEKFVEARSACQLEANNGSPFAQFVLGQMWDSGQGGGSSLYEGTKWYRLASDNGHTRSMLRLGNKYQYGYGAPVKLEEAEKWYLRAAEKGQKKAYFQLGALYVKQKVWVQAYYWYKKSSEAGDESAMEMVKILEHGDSEGHISIR